MAKIVGEAGKGINKLIRKRKIKILIWAAFFYVGLYFAYKAFLHSLKSSAIIAILGFAVLVRFLYSSVEKETDEIGKRIKHARKGKRGEEFIGSILEKLPDNYTVIHDIETPYGNVDHIVVGPTGVFVIETKSHHGRITERNGLLLRNNKPLEKNFIKQVLDNTFYIKEKIKESVGIEAYVKALLVFTNAYVDIKREIANVKIINKSFLLKAIKNSRTSLTDEQINSLEELLLKLKEQST